MANKTSADYITKDVYKFYKNDVGKENAVDYKTFIKIIEEYYQEILKLVIYKNFEFRLPFRLGTFLIKAKKSFVKLDENNDIMYNTYIPDWFESKKLWAKKWPGETPEELKKRKNKPIVRHLNEHSNGKRMLWYWDKTISNVPNQNYYRININRYSDRELAGAIKEGKLNFYE